METKLFQLRDYQIDIINKTKEALIDNPQCRKLIQLPTGMGKTVVFAHAIKQLNKQTLVIAHREELLQQAKEKIISITGIPPENIDIVLQSKPNPNAQIWIASIQTLVRGNRLEKINPDLVIIDEAHHSIATSYKKVIKHFSNKPILGFTATPTRRTPKEKKQLAELWDELLYSYKFKTAIKDGWLANLIYYQVISDINIDSVKTTHGDFQINELEEKVNVFSRNKAIIDKYLEVGGGKAIVFCVNIAHTIEITKLFLEEGIETYFLSGLTPKNQRTNMINDFKKANIANNIVICNCMVLSEGFDCPDVRIIILARPTQSEIVYLQQLGRGTRITDTKKEVIIIDIVDNCKNKKLRTAITTVFQLKKKMQGNILKKIEQEKQKYLLQNSKLEELDEEEQESLALTLSNILLELPEDFRNSGLNWCALDNNKYFCQLDNKHFVTVRDNMLKYKLYHNYDLILTSNDVREIIKKAQDISLEFLETKYIWNSGYRSYLDKKAATEKQQGLIKKIAPHVNPAVVSCSTASKIISIVLAKKKLEPATIKQKNYLKYLRYAGNLANLSKKQAGKLIGQLKGACGH